MTIPSGFQFSQSNLQDYVECRRRFYLRYFQQLSWPAIQTQPVLEQERTMQQGAWFHRLVQQHQIGLPIERLRALIQDQQLLDWWENYLATVPAALAGQVRYPELSLSAPLEQFRLAAKFDLAAVTPDGQVTIFDWKTNRRRPRRSDLAQRLQTRVYPYLMARAGGYLNPRQPLPVTRSILPERIRMIYWFAEFPGQAEIFQFDQRQYQADEIYLQQLIREIDRLGVEQFTLTPDERRCAYCVYRSFCERGVAAGDRNQAGYEVKEDLVSSVDVDFEQISEIAF